MNILDPLGNVAFKPWKGPQERFWNFKGRYALIAGSGYSGKTDLLRWYPWQQVAEENERIKAGEIESSAGWCLYLRREMPLLREVMVRCERDFELACPEIKWKAQEKTWVFPNGYRMTFGHMEHAEDWQKYRGWQLSMICWDELTTFTSDQFDMLDPWLRQPKGSKLIPVMRAGTNPIGEGRKWVRERFVRAGKPNEELVKIIKAEVELEDGTKQIQTVRRSQIFIPANVGDNKSVDQAAYIASLDGKAKAIVDAMLYGKWDAATGDLIGTAWDDAVHIVAPFKVPTTRHLFRSCHFSYAATTVQWYAVDYEGNLTCYRDLFLANHTAKMVAERIREMEEDAGEWNVDKDHGSKITGVLGPALAWSKEKQRGPSPAETMRRVGLSFRRAEENLHSAVDQVRDRLIMRSKHPTEKDEWGKPLMTVPGVRFFKTCVSSLESVPSMVADKNDPDLPDPKIESSAYRALCYSAMSRPLTPERSKPRDDDWESWEKPKARRSGSKSGLPGMW